VIIDHPSRIHLNQGSVKSDKKQKNGDYSDDPIIVDAVVVPDDENPPPSNPNLQTTTVAAMTAIVPSQNNGTIVSKPMHEEMIYKNLGR